MIKYSKNKDRHGQERDIIFTHASRKEPYMESLCRLSYISKTGQVSALLRRATKGYEARSLKATA
jgi:hypothetical protein